MGEKGFQGGYGFSYRVIQLLDSKEEWIFRWCMEIAAQEDV